MSWTQMGKSSMPAAPWKQFEALIERLKETDRYHNFLWTTTIITTKIKTTLITRQIKSSPCTFSPTCGARSWVRPSQRPSCWKTIFIHLWPSRIILWTYHQHSQTCFVTFETRTRRRRYDHHLGANACSQVRSSSPSVFLSAYAWTINDLLWNVYFLKSSNIWGDGIKHCPWADNNGDLLKKALEEDSVVVAHGQVLRVVQLPAGNLGEEYCSGNYTSRK